MSWAEWAAGECRAIAAAGRWREVRDFDATGPRGVLDGDRRPVVSFASNDYLGLTTHPAVLAAAHDAVDRWGTGAGAARLLMGSRPVHSVLEEALAEWKDTERAVLFASGFAANLGVLTTFGAAGGLICSDERNHASIVDGCRLAPAQVAVYRHGDLDHLARLLEGATQPLVATEGVFSMDGDVAPLDGIAELCRRHGALLVLDEAHSVLGPAPALDGVEVVRVGTLSKALGSAGGFAAAAGPLADLLVNRARSYIFTTAPAPAQAAAALAALGVVRSPEGEALLGRLRARVHRVAPGHPSPIIPVVLGSEADAVAASAALLERGLLVPAIRPPTVAPGTSRLRVSLSAAHTHDQVEALAVALADVARGLDSWSVGRLTGQ